MALLPVTYPPIPEKAIATYNFTDIAEGTGVVLFQGFNTQIAPTTVEYHLTENQSLFSNFIETADATATHTLNFDLSPFNLPKDIVGTAYVRFSSAISASEQTTVHTVTVKKVATDLSTVNLGSVVSADISGNNVKFNVVMPITLSLTHFKKGEVLRVEYVRTKTGAGTVTIAHDPANRDGVQVTPAATYPTKFEVYIPFRIDL